MDRLEGRAREWLKDLHRREMLKGSYVREMDTKSLTSLLREVEREAVRRGAEDVHREWLGLKDGPMASEDHGYIDAIVAKVTGEHDANE